MTRDPFDAIAAEVKRRGDREREILRQHQEASAVAVRRSSLAEYRCDHQKDCLLFRGWRTPGGDVYVIPGYKLEPATNLATSSDEGRRINTIDGDRRWRARGGDLDDLRRATNPIDVRCAHGTAWLLPANIIGDVDAATPGNPTRRKIEVARA